MLTDRLIICIGSSWDYDPTSKHHIMRVLSRTNDVLWVNYHGTRKPKLNRHDWRDAIGALRGVARRRRFISPRMTQMTPLVLPGAKNAITRVLHEKIVIAQIHRAVSRIDPQGTKPVQVWSFAPDTPFLRGKFNEECFVYYCTDDYRQFQGIESQRLALLEDELIDRADVVVAASAPLRDARSDRRQDILLMRHGVEYQHFAAAWKNPPAMPADLESMRPPIIGFFGLIHHWIDLKLIARLAMERPDYSIVLIGDCKVDVSCLRDLHNVHFLGRKSHSELPAYCAHFDAAMLPFVSTPMTRSINPIKMYEYLAAGLPIVSTPLPEARRFPQAILIGESTTEFVAACDASLDLSSRKDRKAISALVERETWESRVEHLSDQVRLAISRGKKVTVPAGRENESPISCPENALAISLPV